MAVEQQTKPTVTIPRRPWRFAMTGCLVSVAFLVLALLGSLLLVLNNPTHRATWVECPSQMREIGLALERYAIKNDGYPTSLDVLAPDYIPAKLLHCPADKGDSESISYTYHRPAADAPGEKVILECYHHKSRNGALQIAPQCLKNGKITFSFSEPQKGK